MQVSDNDNHSSLLQYAANEGRKNTHSSQTSMVVKKTF